MCNNGNSTIKVVLDNGTVKTNLELIGIKGVKSIVSQIFEQFLESMEDDEGQENKAVDVMEEMKKIYDEVAMKGRIEQHLHTVEKDSTSHKTDQTIAEEENWVKPVESQLDKYNKEFPKLQDALSRNLYNKLTELQINQHSYYVTDNGVLKLQARYSCTCGNFKKAWIVYPVSKKSVRCTECSKVNTLVSVKGNFPSTDEFGNFFVTSNMIKSIVGATY